MHHEPRDSAAQSLSGGEVKAEVLLAFKLVENHWFSKLVKQENCWYPAVPPPLLEGLSGVRLILTNYSQELRYAVDGANVIWPVLDELHRNSKTKID